MKDLFLLLRPQQWLKNFFVFLPLFFDRHLFDLEFVIYSIIAFFSFCFISSSIYCLNDIKDKDFDRIHPIKKKRAIASGKVSDKTGYILAIILFLLSFFSLWPIPYPNIVYVAMCVGIYFIINVAYCLILKQIPIVDFFIISFGFLLRLFAGATSTGIHLSVWIIMMTFLIAMFLAMGKRRDDVVYYEKTGFIRRKSISNYNLKFLDSVISMIGGIIIFCYIMYTISPEVVLRFNSDYIYLTSIFVIAGIIRYLQITFVEIKSGSPTSILISDRVIQICIFLWLISFFFFLYL